MHKFLKVYVWFYIIISIIVALTNKFVIVELIKDCLVGIFSVICVFLYINDKKWLPRLFWKIFFLIQVIDLAYSLSPFKNQGLTTVEYLIGSSVSLVLVMPILAANYRYAFRREVVRR